MENRPYTREEYTAWIRSFPQDGYVLKENGNELIMESDYAEGHIVFRDMEITELFIVTKADGVSRFYLHFQLKEEEHAKELYTEMRDSFLDMKDNHRIRVLLSCSSALTTSYFAEELQKTADSLNLPYDFRAVSYDRLYAAGPESDVILLAPQISFELVKVKEAFHHRIVLPIPAGMFGKYDTAGMIMLIQKELENRKHAKKPTHPEAITENDEKILVIGVVNRRDGKRYGYRLYDHGKVTDDGEVIKPNMTIEDIADIIDTCMVKHSDIDIVGLALPGAAAFGVLDYPELGFHHVNVVDYFTSRYPMDFYLCNDVNAAAAGYHAEHPEDLSLAFYYIPEKMKAPGIGIIMHNIMIKGYNGFAGEVGAQVKYMNDIRGREEDDMTKVLMDTLIPLICNVAPMKIVMNVRQYPDLEPLIRRLEEYIDPRFLPKFEQTWRMKRYMLPGMVQQCLEYLNHKEERNRIKKYISGLK